MRIPPFVLCIIIAWIIITYLKNRFSEGFENGTKCSTDYDCNPDSIWKEEHGRNICRSDGTCHCKTGSGDRCEMGPMNYKNPMDMTSDERRKFMSDYKDDMTIVDYKNWLMLFRRDRGRLPYVHLRNLEKLERGEKMDMPSREYDVLDVTGLGKQPYIVADPSDYFKNKYTGTKYLRKQDDTLLDFEKKLLVALQKPQLVLSSRELTALDKEKYGWLPSNLMDYRDTMPPQDVAIDSASAMEKVDAYAVDYFLRPRASTGDIESAIGREWVTYEENRRLSQDEHMEDYHQRAETDNFARPADL